MKMFTDLPKNCQVLIAQLLGRNDRKSLERLASCSRELHQLSFDPVVRGIFIKLPSLKKADDIFDTTVYILKEKHGDELALQLLRKIDIGDIKSLRKQERKSWDQLILHICERGYKRSFWFLLEKFSLSPNAFFHVTHEIVRNKFLVVSYVQTSDVQGMWINILCKAIEGHKHSLLGDLLNHESSEPNIGIQNLKKTIVREYTLHTAVRHNNLVAIKKLLNHPLIRPNALNFENLTPLQYAARTNKAAALKVLVQHAKVRNSINNPQHRNFTVLHEACASNSSEVVRTILDIGLINVNSRETKSKQRTPFHVAVENLSIDCLNILKDSPHLRLDIADANGRTSLDVCHEKIAFLKDWKKHDSKMKQRIFYDEFRWSGTDEKRLQFLQNFVLKHE